MQKILIGLLALLVLAVVVGAATHWLAGMSIVVVPVAVTFLRLKLSPAYRSATNKSMKTAIGDQGRKAC